MTSALICYTFGSTRAVDGTANFIRSVSTTEYNCIELKM